MYAIRLVVSVSLIVASSNAIEAKEIAAGFNDASGINSNSTPDSPYTIFDTVEGMGVGEPGWDGGWIGPNGPPNQRFVQGSTVFEGDGALSFFTTTTSAERRFVDSQTGVMSVSLRLNITQMSTGDRDFIFRLQQDAPPVGSIAVQWQAEPDGFFKVVDGGTKRNTGIAWLDNVWHEVVVRVDFPNKEWTFSVDGVTFANGGQPLAFRGNPTQLDKIHLLSELSNINTTAFVDDIRVNGDFPSVPTEISIDVLPDSDDNPIKLNPAGRLPVAILSSSDFDATTVDVSTIRFADVLLIDTLGQSPVKINVEDVDGDGLDDLLVLFSKNDLVNSGAVNEDTIAVGLSAETTLGEAIIGLDFVTILE